MLLYTTTNFHNMEKQAKPKIEYHLCQYIKLDGNICNTKTSKEFCRYHNAKSINNRKCSYDGCTRNCRHDRCHLHTEQRLEKNRIRAREYRLANKMAVQ